ncbi:glycosyltransferase family 2 protein [Campylobacter lari]|uniref:glycosyltransferase family 2 protein n=1 Tax=Campylobacter TaxID=194 RepID=UPI00372D64AB
MKKVGVVIPIYNVEKYLKECLDSVINQTYTNLEIILVNDGSTDENSLNIAKEYTLKDKRITLFDKKNGGLSSARNVGIEYFSGEYKLKNKTQTIKENSLIEFNIDGNNPYEIYTVYKSYKAFKNEQDLTNFTYPIIDYIIFLDSDDYWELNCIEECVPRMDGVEVVWMNYHFYYYDINLDDDRKTLLERCGFQKGMKITSQDLLLRMYNISRDSFWFAWQGMINFNFLKSIKLKFLNEILHEDHYFGKLLFFQASNICVLTNKLLYHRIRKGSIMNYTNDIINIPEYMLHEFMELYEDSSLFNFYYRESSLFLTSIMVFVFIKESNFENKKYFLKVFHKKLLKWRKRIFTIDNRYLNKIIFFIFRRFMKLYKENSFRKNENEAYFIFFNFIDDFLEIKLK